MNGGILMKNLNFAVLLEVYGSMLTEKQRSAAELYYWEDMSLGEIAEDMNVTRQAVRDGIKRSEQKLSELEENLGLAAKITDIKKIFGEIAELSVSPDNNKKIQELAQKGRDLL